MAREWASDWEYGFMCLHIAMVLMSIALVHLPFFPMYSVLLHRYRHPPTRFRVYVHRERYVSFYRPIPNLALGSIHRFSFFISSVPFVDFATLHICYICCVRDWVWLVLVAGVVIAVASVAPVGVFFPTSFSSTFFFIPSSGLSWWWWHVKRKFTTLATEDVFTRLCILSLRFPATKTNSIILLSFVIRSGDRRTGYMAMVYNIHFSLSLSFSISPIAICSVLFLSFSLAFIGMLRRKLQL